MQAFLYLAVKHFVLFRGEKIKTSSNVWKVEGLKNTLSARFLPLTATCTPQSFSTL